MSVGSAEEEKDAERCNCAVGSQCSFFKGIERKPGTENQVPLMATTAQLLGTENMLEISSIQTYSAAGLQKDARGCAHRST